MNQDTSFPSYILEGCQDALVVFAAAFGGAQDAEYVRKAGLRATCVDSDYEALRRMEQGNYPADWSFFCIDAFAFDWSGFDFDVVTLDPFTGKMMDETIGRLDDFSRLARRFLIVGVDGRQVFPPTGWRIRCKTWRSSLKGGVYWLVMERI